MVEIKELSIKELKSLLEEKNLLEFNRDISDMHVLKMQQSVLECGLLRLPVIGDVSAFDRRKLVIVDGQHLCKALVKLPKDKQLSKVSVIVKTYQEKKDVISDVAKLNNTQKTWNDENFLEAWYKYGKENEYFSNYSYLYNQYNEIFNSLPCGFMVDLYARDKDAFKEGELEFKDRELGDYLAEICHTLKVEYNKSSFTLHGLRLWAFHKHFVEKREIDRQKLRSRLLDAVRKGEDKNCAKREDFRDFVQEIYTKI